MGRSERREEWWRQTDDGAVAARDAHKLSVRYRKVVMRAMPASSALRRAVGDKCWSL